MGKGAELKELAKGYMAQKKEIKENNENLKQLKGTQALVTSLKVQEDGKGTDIMLFLARANDKMESMADEVDKANTVTDALQRSLAKTSVELNQVTQANFNLNEENTRLRELVAGNKGEMYELLHNESKDNLIELSNLRSDNVGLKADALRLDRELKDATLIANQVPELQKSIDLKDNEIEGLKLEVKRLTKEIRIYKSQTTKTVTDDDSDMLLQ